MPDVVVAVVVLVVVLATGSAITGPPQRCAVWVATRSTPLCSPKRQGLRFRSKPRCPCTVPEPW